MIVPALGFWEHAAGKRFVRDRIYLQGWRWTPFARIHWRCRHDS